MYHSIILIVFSLIFSSCVKLSTVVKDPKKDNGPLVILFRGSDPVPKDLLNLIIKRTNYFCNNKYTTDVKKIIIQHNAEKRSTRVLYTCKEKDR